MSLHGNDSPGPAQDCQDYQPLHDLAHEPWPSWDMWACIEPSSLDYICLVPS